jgi:pterin-4a-carbinolamine dehydratase
LSSVFSKLIKNSASSPAPLPVKTFLLDSYGISVHFSSLHANYYTSWRYVTKEDQSAEESEGHPDLKNSNGPKTMNAHIATRALRIVNVAY